MLIKPNITISPIDNRKLCSFAVDNPILGRLKLDSRMEYNRGFKRLLIELKNKQDKLLGSEELCLSQYTADMTGLSISVGKEFRNNGSKNFRFGEIIRLASIIDMLENNKKIFKIFSKATAVYFHSKYKFEPNITGFSERERALQTIKDDTSKELSQSAEQASMLLQKIKSATDSATQRHLCIPANKIVKEYIKNVEHLGRQEYKSHPFQYGMDMVLTYDGIIKSRPFFNKLFYNHGIDYTI